LFFAKATAAMHQSPESNRQDWILHWVLGQATAAMHRSSESNRQDWILLRASSLGPWPSDGCHSPIFRIQPSGLVSTPLFRSLGKPRLRCTDLPNPTVRIGFHKHLWFLDQATAPMHQSPQTQRPRIGYFYYTHASFAPCQSDGCDAPIHPQPTARMYARVTMDRLFT
jgi:hypothetical protein